MRRYSIHPIASSACDSLAETVLATADTEAEAKDTANDLAGAHFYGVGIRDAATGEIDVGFGFGGECPADGDAQ